MLQNFPVFSTKQLHGVLMYFGDSEHLAVELFNGRIRISYDVGNHPTSTMYRLVQEKSCEMMMDGSSRKLKFYVRFRRFMVNGKAQLLVWAFLEQFMGEAVILRCFSGVNEWSVVISSLYSARKIGERVMKLKIFNFYESKS